MAVGSAGMLFALSPQLGALILAVFPAVFVLGAWQGRAMRSEQKGVQRALADAGALASRSLTSLRTLRALGVEQAQLDGYSLAIDGARAQAVTVGVRAAVFDAAVGLAANISLLGVMARGSMLVGAGELTAGALSSVVLYALWVGFASSQLAQCYADAARAAGASERLLQLMSREPQMNSSGGTRLALPAGARGLAVEFDAVRFAYATRVDSTDLGDRADDAAELSAAKGCGAAPTAAAAAAADARARADAPYATAHDGSIRALSLSIGAGERVGLVGASGCGKSTLLRLISRLYDVDGGAVRLGGVDVRALEPRQLRGGLVAVVPQEPALLAGSIRYNIALCSRFDGAEAETALAAAVEAAELGPLMRSLPDGLDTQVGEGGVTLSGGEKQRVAISRMLLADPAVVLLDEFTSALDQATEARVAAQLRPLLAGRTVIAVAHRSSALRGLDVSRVIELGSGGQIVRDLGLDEWMRSQRSPASAMDGATDDMQQRFA
jgi:ATP-binding cassette subfamily B protein